MTELFARYIARTAVLAVLAFVFCGFAYAQKPQKASPPVPAGPKITRIDIDGLKALLKPGGKPLLVNFWATWCDPCREEFPELVKIDAIYKGKIDFITVSLDDIDDIDTVVPKFLREQKAEMPAYLLKTPDESAAISMVSKDWSGSLPLTVLFGPGGELAYQRAGKIRYETVVAELDKVLAKSAPPSPSSTNK